MFTCLHPYYYILDALKKQKIKTWYLDPKKNTGAAGITEKGEAVVNAKV